MTQPAIRQPVTFAEYIQNERTSELKHQLFDSEGYAMSGGTPEHAALILSVGAELLRQLRGRPCRAFSSELRVRAGDLTTYPDCTVVCGPLDRDPEDSSTVRNPTLLVEVLSESTEGFDRGRKFEQYRRIPSLREYVLVNQRAAHRGLHARGARLGTARGWGRREDRAGVDCLRARDRLGVRGGVWRGRGLATTLRDELAMS